MLLQWIFFISLLLSYLTSDKLMGFDGRYGSKICINCFTLNHLCSMWSSTDWFPPFKQAFHTAARWKDTALIFGLFHSLNCGDSPEEVTPPHLPTAAPGWQHRAWTQVRDLQELQTRPHGTDRDGLYCLCTLVLQALQSVSTPPPHPAPAFSCAPPAWQVSTPPRAGRFTAKVQPFSWGHAFTWENHIPKNSQNWKLVLSFYSFLYVLEYFYKGIT